MTEEQAIETADGTAEETIENRTPNRAPRITGLALLLVYAFLPISGVFAFAVACLVAVILSQITDLIVVNNEDVRAALARGQLGIATRTIIRELSIIALVLSEAWASRDSARLAALCVVGVGGLRLLYQLMMVLVRRRAVLPVESRNIDLTGIKPPPLLPDLMRRRLSERFHGLSAIALGGAALGVVTESRATLFAIVGVVLAVEVIAVAAAMSWLLRSRGTVIREKYWQQVYLRVHALAPEVMLYHTGSADSTHQVNMWLGACEQLNRRAIVALRERGVFEELDETPLPVICIPDSVDFMTFALPEIRVAMYTANVGKTIHMLREPGVRHVFIGHGDSDKTASFNPFSRVYSEVWVAGQAGRDRYAKAHVGVRDEDIVEVGRPQLDGIEVATERIGDREMTVLYAPTWEGWTGDPAHTSLIRTGPALIDRLLNLGNVRIIYKPHPFTGTVSRDAAASDARIRATLGRAGEQHQVVVEAAPTLYECFNDADLMVADISSVLSDFIYSEKPYVVANLTGLDEAAFREQYPSAGAAYLLDPSGDRIGAIIDLVREADPLAAERRDLKHYLLGPDEPDAMTRFSAAVDAAYDRAVAETPIRVAAGREA
ncbi:MAG: CDP-glycerol glycerophosphotransferase family protein [Frankiaceae bacterium]|nr:CDP-glycerol glycerophosphotransferase family protein [Frankiaceae bacterium]